MPHPRSSHSRNPKQPGDQISGNIGAGDRFTQTIDDMLGEPTPDSSR